jgi:hypothetical protein
MIWEFLIEILFVSLYDVSCALPRYRYMFDDRIYSLHFYFEASDIKN